MKRATFAILCLAMLACALSSNARAGDKGGIAFILEHGKELELNDAQKHDLNAMRTLEDRTRAKILAEPEVKKLIQKALAAKLHRDDAAATEAWGSVIQKVIEKSLPVATPMMEQLGKLLTPTQLAKIEELKESQETKKKNADEKAKRNEPARPKSGTPPPNPFEF